ncbi:MAG: DUF1566 domain-containing protein, partial [Leptospirillia bacterium]
MGEKIGIGYTLTRSLERARRCGRVLFSASRRLAAPVVAMLLLFCYAPAFADPLPKTGQTFCYDASGVTIACLGTGQDGDNQAGVPWPAPRFTDNLDGSISDHLDGLMWVQDANLLLTRDPGFDADGTAGDGAVTWQTALNYVAQLNATAYLGYTDWRLPNRHELRSLADYDWALPALPAGHPFIGLPATNFPYWTSTSDATTPASAWGVDIDFGTTAIADKVATSTQFVWPVRNGAIGTISLNATGQTVCYDAAGTVIACAGTGQDGELLAGTPFPVPRFTDNLDGTVSDNLTTLMWIQDANLMLSRDPGVDTSGKGDGAVVWQTGLDYAALLNSQAYLGYVDWRMPNISELQSLADADTVGAPRLPAGHPFLNVNSSYWSSTTSTANPAMAMIALTFGEVAEGTKVSNKKSDLRFVWLVRGGTYNPPVLAPIGNQAVDEGATLNVTATATDLDGDPLTLAATGLPAFCSFTDNLNDSGSLACTPGQTDAGVYSGITVAANDGLLNDSEVISLTVAAVNVAPVLAPIGNQSVDEGAALNLTVTASDADGDALTLIAAGLPAFCSFTDNLNGTGSLDCTPGQMDAGNYPGISVTAADGILSANEVITLTVNDVNRAPVLNPIGAQS